jgi:cephalosporin hydroxylase
MLTLHHISERDASEGYPGPVPALQRVWEFAQMLDLYRQRRPRSVLEVGSYHGGTLYHWLTTAAPGAFVVSVDLPPAGVDNRALFHAWCPPGVELHCLRGDSRDPAILAAVEGIGPFDWVFLDAGHAREEIAADWAAYRPLVADGGVIALHDILPGRGPQAWIEVCPVWRAIQRQGYVTQEIVASEDVNWGGIGVVYL